MSSRLSTELEPFLPPAPALRVQVGERGVRGGCGGSQGRKRRCPGRCSQCGDEPESIPTGPGGGGAACSLPASADGTAAPQGIEKDFLADDNYALSLS